MDRLSEPVTNPAEIEEFKFLCARIPNNAALRDLLMKSSPGNRRTMYLSMVPYLSFRPASYFSLTMGRAKKAHASN